MNETENFHVRSCKFLRSRSGVLSLGDPRRSFDRQQSLPEVFQFVLLTFKKGFRKTMDSDHWNDVVLKDGLTVAEIADMLDAEDEDGGNSDEEIIEAVFITPPEPAVLTDEDSGEEDEGGMLNNLNRNQLLSEAEAVLSSKKRLGGESWNFSGYNTKRPRKWMNGDLVDPVDKTKLFESDSSFAKYSGLSPVEAFEIFLHDQLISTFIDESIKYARSKNDEQFTVSVEEIKAYLGILILSGYSPAPTKRSYWETKPDVRNTLVADCMRRDRFLQIARFFHVADNNEIDRTDKMHKLRPLIESLKKSFMENFVPTETLSYDESMIKYFGPHSCKQFIRGKPIRFGYKVWSLNTSYGYLVNFEIYQGKSTPGRNPEYDRVFGKCTSPLLGFLDEFPDEKQNYPYHIFTDNLFTSLNLLKHLKERGYSGTGTLRQNRLPNDCPLPSNERMKRAPRGTAHHVIEKLDGIFVAKWKDNSIVTIASNAKGNVPSSFVKRYNREEKKHVQVVQPCAINTYNKNMGGTDRMDQDVSRYRIAVRAKKWYGVILTWLIDVAINNAWLLVRMAGQKISKLEFKRSIALTYLTQFKIPSKSAGGATSTSSRSSRVLPSIRYDRKDHFLCEGNRRRCAHEGCTSTVRTMCIKCDVGLCINCNLSYHTNKNGRKE